MDTHGITAALPTHPPTGRRPASPASTISPYDMMAHLDGHFDNLAAAATYSGETLNQLATTKRTQYAEIMYLLIALKTASGLSSYAAAAATDSTPSIPPAEAKHHISQLEADISKNWHRGAFCSTHGWGVN